MESISLFWGSLWQGPKIAGMVFAIFLLAALLVRRAIIARRSKVAYRAQSEDVGAKDKGRKMKRGAKRTDKAFHVPANTMPLGVSKLVRTGSPYDKGVMS